MLNTVWGVGEAKIGQVNNSNRKNICVVTSTYPDYPGSTRGIFIQNLLSSFRESLTFHVVTPKIFKKSRSTEKYDNQVIRRFWFPSENKLLVNYERIPYFRMAIYLLTGLLKTIKVAVREKCFLIESHFIVPTGLIGCVAAKILRKPFTVSAHGADITTTDTGLSIAAHPLLKKLIKIVLRRADYVIANSEFSKKILESLGADPSKIQITWAGGIDESMFYPVKDKALLRDKFRLSHDEVIILFVGNLTRKKGVNFLVESFRQMKAKKLSLRLLLVGDGEVRKELETEIIRTGMENDILLMGALPYAQVSEIYALSDIFVLPSLMEGMGRVIIEAMSSGLAVIGSRVGGINDLIQDGKDGILFQPGSVDDLTRCLNLLIGDEELRLKLGAEARLKVKNKFSRKIQKQKMNEIYTRFSATGARK